MYNPVSTYRLQFNKNFTFDDAEALVGYFGKLGIKTIYASPIFKAVAGSMHGYDVVNPYEVNPEIGDIDKLRTLIHKLRDHGIGWVQDIVPNHMAYHHSNPWLLDLLEKGSLSVYANVFDVTWASEFFHARIMAPFIDGSLEEVIQRKELKIMYWKNRLCFHYGEQVFPLNSRTYGALLEGSDYLSSIKVFTAQLDSIHHVTDPVQYAFSWHELLLQFASLMSDGETRVYVDTMLNEVNEDPKRLKNISDDQFYRLCHWKETDHQINYRRFFLVNGLICLNMQSDKVFARYHETIHALINEGLFQGLRVDHIDGLYDPTAYLERLRGLCGHECYIIVEKILEPNESLNSKWPIQGTTGYEFLSAVNNLFTKNSSENKFSALYRSITGDTKSIHERIRDKKTMILHNYMKGELQNLSQFFVEHIKFNDDSITNNEIKEAISEFLIEVPVYRFYGNRLPLKGEERSQISSVITACSARRSDLANAFALFERIFLNDSDAEPAHLEFYQRCMQFTGPLMAKGVEDTLMYTFNRFVGHNEVGDSPEFFGLTVDEFHKAMFQRLINWPWSLNATSTHDTKRGEDVRMRLNVLPDLAGEWVELVKDWMKENASLKINGAPDPNDEYFIYQNLIGIYPVTPDSDLEDRVKAYLTKSMRESKRYSDWAEPDKAYESAVLNFVHEILQEGTPFMKSFLPFLSKVSSYGMINSLAQTTLKCTCPGVPDIYQGTTNWDLTLVDPDNRRIVDYNKHEAWLNDVTSMGTEGAEIHTLWQDRVDGRIKLWLTHQLLNIRNAHQELFNSGQYIPLEIEGRRQHHCMAFARRHNHTWVVVAVPLNIGRLANTADDLLDIDWDDTRIIIPFEAPGEWQGLLTNNKGKHKGEILFSSVIQELPIAVLLLHEQPRARKAGVLLALSSLPSDFGVGDLGPAARRFADFLSRSRQSIWQLLPINPTHDKSGFSPYSSYASMAGSMVYISVEDLTDDGLLDPGEIANFRIMNRGVSDYDKAAKSKIELLTRAYESFQRNQPTEFMKDFVRFKEKESDWLDDYALFETISESQSGATWYEWPPELKEREQAALQSFSQENSELINQCKWMQFVFNRQWHALKKYCGERGIQLFGDLPFYVNHNSVEVWAHRDIFSLDAAGNIDKIAGVPPDYFAANGQLWGMPVYRWDVLRAMKYGWFVKRIRRNLEFFDILRLDHFRAFVNYWEVPGGELTAINGKWIDGPGADLFETIRSEVGGLPFVAEDLGEITPEVYKFRDTFGLPGMKVLQFGFGDQSNENPYIPYNHKDNFVVYTGTHDNNTTKGWYRKELDNEGRKRLSAYAGKKLSATNVSDELIRMAYASVANTAIIPMQDILNLNERSRLNTPSTTNASNWRWRMIDLPDDNDELKLCLMTRVFGR